MAKKKTSGADTAPEAARPAAAARRRAPARRSATVPGQTAQQPTFEEIAEAAYRRYLSRGGAHGRDFDDWLEAERELRTRG